MKSPKEAAVAFATQVLPETLRHANEGGAEPAYIEKQAVNDAWAIARMMVAEGQRLGFIDKD